jgi:hypothetical protein
MRPFPHKGTLTTTFADAFTGEGKTDFVQKTAMKIRETKEPTASFEIHNKGALFD